MKIKWSLSGFIRGIEHACWDPRSPEFKNLLVGKSIYLDRYKKIGEIVDIDPDTDSIYGEVSDGECGEMFLDSKGYNMCVFEIVEG